MRDGWERAAKHLFSRITSAGHECAIILEMPTDYDLVAIGGGAAGLVAAGMSALLGAKTALVEQHRLGGDCTWTGCVPSKTLLHAASLAQNLRTAGLFGIRAGSVQVDFRAVIEKVRQTRKHIYEAADARPNIEKFGVEVIPARARFLDPHTLELTNSSGLGSRLTSRYFVIATGSRAKVPQVNAPLLTNESIFEIDDLPRRLLILGAGPIAIEMAQAFLRLGSEVTIVAPDERILPRDDRELATQLQEVFRAEGIRFLLKHIATKIDKHPGETVATLDDDSTVHCDAVLAAIGREPILEGLDLAKAGVKFGKRGIEIDRHCRTSQRHIYASGDVTGKFLFTHMAEHMSKVAVSNAILHLPQKLDEVHVPWCTYADPELAHVGASEESLQKGGHYQHDVYRFAFSHIDRATTEGQTTGMIKVLVGHRGKILGATILGANAGEMIAEYALAMKNGLTVANIADTIHAYPTYALGNRQAADKWYTNKLTPGLIRTLQFVFRYRGSASAK